MGNPQHLEWLLEGVDAWNSRREREDFKPDLSGLDLHEAYEKEGKFNHIGRIRLEQVNFETAALRGANLRGADLEGANFRLADLAGANLADAILRSADLREADLEGADLEGAWLGWADIRTVYIGMSANDFGTPKCTDLSTIRFLTQDQLDSMTGDTRVILPDGLLHPADWSDPEPPFPELPDQDPPKDLNEDEGRIALADLDPPKREDLEAIHTDLREDVQVLHGAGSFNNISKGFDAVFSRFARIVDRDYSTLDQKRFGLQTAALRTRLEGLREELETIDPAKLADLEATLMAAELLAARLPEWQIFLAETREERGVIQENTEEVDSALLDASEVMEADPEHFDASVPTRLQEYRETKTIDAYLVGVNLLNDLAFVVFRAVRDFARDTGTAARKVAVAGLATSLVAGLGSVLLRLAGKLPEKLQWIEPWLKYIPTIFGA